MVQLNTLFRRRIASDINNFDFVMDNEPEAIGTDGFPIWRELDDPIFTSTVASLSYKQTDLNDLYGLYTTFFVHPGVRKIRQIAGQITISQKTSAYVEPAFLISFLGFRPGFYNDETQIFTPQYDYFRLDRNASMACNNLHEDLLGLGSSDISGVLASLGVIPETIAFAAGGTFRTRPCADFALVSAMRHTGTITKGNDVYTTHDHISPFLNHTIDVSNLPEGFILQAKIMTFVATLRSEGVGDTAPLLRLIPSEDVLSFSAPIDVI